MHYCYGIRWLLIVTLLSYTTIVDMQEIIDGPHSINTTLNTNVNFTGIVSGTTGFTIVWLTNGKITEHHPPLNIMGENTHTHYVVQATSALNGSNITFAALPLGSGETKLSGNALLLIQGILDPPAWSNTNFIGSNLTLNWDQPYSLENVPISGYRVIVKSNDAMSSVNTDMFTSNLTQSLTIEGFTSSNCSSIEAAISARNSVGDSVWNNITLLHPGGITVPSINASLSYTNSDSLTLQIDAKMMFNCKGIIPVSVTFMVESLHDNTLYTITSNGNLTIVNDNDSVMTMVSSVVTDNIAQNKLYRVDLSVQYEGGRDLIMDTLQTSSYDTQSIELGKSTSGKLCLRCQFLFGTSANGCLMHITRHSGTNSSSTTLIDTITSSIASDGETLSQWECTTATNSGPSVSYSIVAFDQESDFTTNEVLSINEVVESESIDNLPIVVNDQPLPSTTTTSTTTISMTSSSTTTDTVSSIVSDGVDKITLSDSTIPSVKGSSPSSSPAAIVTSSLAVLSVSPNVGGVELSSSSQPSSLIIISVGVAVGVIIILIVVIAIITVCTVLRRRKIKGDRLRIRQCNTTTILMEANSVYGSDVVKQLDNGHIYSEIRDIVSPYTTTTTNNTTTATPVVISNQNSCYSTVRDDTKIPLPMGGGQDDVGQQGNGGQVETEGEKKPEEVQDEWIPNPTYQLAPFNTSISHPIPAVPAPVPVVPVDNGVVDDKQEHVLSIEVCPAYTSSMEIKRPLNAPPSNGQQQVNDKVIYEEL